MSGRRGSRPRAGSESEAHEVERDVLGPAEANECSEVDPDCKDEPLTGRRVGCAHKRQGQERTRGKEARAGERERRTELSEDGVHEAPDAETCSAEEQGLEASTGGAARVGADDDEEGAVERDRVRVEADEAAGPSSVSTEHSTCSKVGGKGRRAHL